MLNVLHAGAGCPTADPHEAPGPPTGYEILRHCRGIQVLWQDGTHRYVAFPHYDYPALRVILAALDVTEAIYTTVRARCRPAGNSLDRPG